MRGLLLFLNILYFAPVAFAGAKVAVAKPATKASAKKATARAKSMKPSVGEDHSALEAIANSIGGVYANNPSAVKLQEGSTRNLRAMPTTPAANTQLAGGSDSGAYNPYVGGDNNQPSSNPPSNPLQNFPLSFPGMGGGGGGGDSALSRRDRDLANEEPRWDSSNGETGNASLRNRAAGSRRRQSTPAEVEQGTRKVEETLNAASSEGPSCKSTAGAPTMWEAVSKITSGDKKNGFEPVIPARSGYALNASTYGKLAKDKNGKLKVRFEPSKVSQCVSATGAAILQHIADLVNEDKLVLSDSQLNELNKGDGVFANAVRGNTYSILGLFKHLGGDGTYATGASGRLSQALKMARKGDVLKYDRTNGTGHSTIFSHFDESTGNVCYWSSNRATRGPDMQCENISRFKSVAIARFPSDLDSLPRKIDGLRGVSSNRFYLAKPDGGQLKALVCEPGQPERAREVASKSTGTTT